MTRVVLLRQAFALAARLAGQPIDFKYFASANGAKANGDDGCCVTVVAKYIQGSGVD